MTVSYTGDVGDTSIRTFYRLLWRWKGSIWKAVYVELFVWLVAYGILSIIYNFLLGEDEKRVFENVCAFFAKYEDYIPLTFILGFFVSLVITRWWSMFENLGWIDIVAMYIAHHVHGEDERGRLVRRNLIRHLLFYQVLCYRDISVCIRKRFPRLESCIDAGYITVHELKHFHQLNSRYPQYWTPINWVVAGLRRAALEGRIRSDKEIEDLQRRVMEFRNNLGSLLGYDWVPIPLLYSQVVSISVRLYFIMALFGRQYLDHAVESSFLPPINLYLPIVTIMQFVFYVGWLKVAEALLNPFGGDDDDFEINWLLDRNLEVGYMILDEREPMPLVKDIFWSTSVIYPFYSEATINRVNNPMVGSAVCNKECQPDDEVDESTVMLPRTVNDEEECIRSRTNSVFGNLNSRISRIRNSIFYGDNRAPSAAATSPIPPCNCSVLAVVSPAAANSLFTATAPSSPTPQNPNFCPFHHSNGPMADNENADNDDMRKASVPKLKILLEEEEEQRAPEQELEQFSPVSFHLDSDLAQDTDLDDDSMSTADDHKMKRHNR